jgi:hypothetical protein
VQVQSLPLVQALLLLVELAQTLVVVSFFIFPLKFVDQI